MSFVRFVQNVPSSINSLTQQVATLKKYVVECIYFGQISKPNDQHVTCPSALPQAKEYRQFQNSFNFKQTFEIKLLELCLIVRRNNKRRYLQFSCRTKDLISLSIALKGRFITSVKCPWTAKKYNNHNVL